MDKNLEIYFNELEQLATRAYCPYSKFSVSTILLTNSNKKFTGINVENFAFSATICAERVAICNAITNGEKKVSFKKLFLYTSSNDLIFPCGVCLQFMIELLPENIDVIIFNKIKKVKTFILKDLLPYSKEIKFSGR